MATKPLARMSKYAPFTEVGDNAEALATMLPAWAKTAGEFAREWSVSGSSVQEMCKRLRGLVGGKAKQTSMSEFLLPSLKVQQTVLMHGFHLRFEDEKKAKAAEKIPWLAPEAAMLARDWLREFMLCDNAAALWVEGGARKSGAPAVTVLDTERIVTWENGAFGERLTINSTPDGQSMPDVKPEDVGPRWAQAMKSGKSIMLDESEGEHYVIQSRAKRGTGLARPSLEGTLPLIGQLELLALADRAGAWEHRNLIRQWLIGHEIKYGSRAGMSDHFIKKGHVDAVKKKMSGKVGPTDLYTNFDWKIHHVYLDTAYFKKEKYEGGLERLALWFGPVGRLLREEIADNDIGLVRAWIDDERAQLAGALESILNSDGYWESAQEIANAKGGKLRRPDGWISAGFSPVTLMTPKQVLELVRFATAQGIFGATTAREMLGLDAECERSRLAAEEKKAGHRPNFEQKQGGLKDLAPGTTEAGGRPAE
jgi:hypothetical protein